VPSSWLCCCASCDRSQDLLMPIGCCLCEWIQSIITCSCTRCRMWHIGKNASECGRWKFKEVACMFSQAFPADWATCRCQSLYRYAQFQGQRVGIFPVVPGRELSWPILSEGFPRCRVDVKILHQQFQVVLKCFLCPPWECALVRSSP